MLLKNLEAVFSVYFSPLDIFPFFKSPSSSRSSRDQMLACLLLVACIQAATSGVGGELAARLADPVVQALSVKPEDQEPCAKDPDCDDWCKERHEKQWAQCICRCPEFISHADFACMPEQKFCQPSPPPMWGGSFNVSSGKDFKAKCKKHKLMIVVFSALSCMHCIDFEPSYRWASEALAGSFPV